MADVERTYGVLVAAGNRPTPYQHGTGERMGLFEDANGEIWGLPLNTATGGDILACAPASLRDQRVTDRVPAGSTVVGATNEPTGTPGGGTTM